MPTPRWLTTTRADGDFAGAGAFGPDTTWLRQVHGSDVVVVTRPGEHAGADADAAVTTVAGCRLAIRTADCAPVVLIGDHGVGVVHAGWRGVLGGVVEAAVAALRDAGGGTADPMRAVIGPCVHAECYEFGAADLALVVDRYGPSVAAHTAAGTPALDVRAAVSAALRESGVATVDDVDACTSCDADRYYSHRARAEAARFATIAWLDP